MEDISKKTDELATLLKASSEYREFRESAETVGREPASAVLLAEYRKLRLKLQAAELSGSASDDDMDRLQKLGELLQMDPATSGYLFAEYKLNKLLADIYKKLAGAVGADLGMID